MKEITVKAYEFDELSDAAKEKAREWFRRASDEDNFWSECVIDEAVKQGGHLGIDFKERQVKLYGGGTRGEPCIWWSGFWSQGDGACFEGAWRASDVKADKVAEGWGPDPATTEIKRIAAVFAEIAEKYPHSSFTVKHSGHYQHENCTEFDFDVGNYEWTCEDKPETEGPIEAWERDFPEDGLKENAKDFMRFIYKQLESAYEYEVSDENINQSLSTNETLFTSDGGRIPNRYLLNV